MPTWLKAVGLLSVAAVIMIACGLGGDFTSPAPVVLTEHRTQAVRGSPSKQIGQSCDVGGSAECASGTCVKAGGDSVDTGHVCSKHCSGADGACPAGWRCVQAYPSPDGMLCAPSGQAAAANPVRR